MTLPRPQWLPLAMVSILLLAMPDVRAEDARSSSVSDTQLAKNAPRNVEAGPAAATNLVASEAEGDSNSFGLEFGGTLSLTPELIRVTEQSQAVVAAIATQAGAAWFPSYGGNFPGGKGRDTVVDWEVQINGQTASVGSIVRTGVPSPTEWDDWFGDEGPYPYDDDALTNDQLRTTFDLAFELEAFEEGFDDVRVKLSGHTYVWRNGWTPANWRQTPTEKKQFAELLSPVETVLAEPPYEVWKIPGADSFTRNHPAILTVELWSRNRARLSLGGNAQDCIDPTIVTPGPDVPVGPYNDQFPNSNMERIRERTHDHLDGTHPPKLIQVTPDFDPITTEVLYEYWSLKANRGRKYSRQVTLAPTVLYCVEDGVDEDGPEAEAPTTTSTSSGEGQIPRRSIASPAGSIAPVGEPIEPLNGSARVRIVSKALGNPTLEFDASADANGMWTCHECVESGDQVELQYHYDDPFGRRYGTTIALAVPDSQDLASPEILQIDAPLLELVAVDQDLDPILSGTLRVLDLSSAAFGVLRPIPGVLVVDTIAGDGGTTDETGTHSFAFGQEAVLQFVVSDAAGRYQTLSMPETPPLQVHLTHREVEPGVWQDRRLHLWMTPDFSETHLHVASGRILEHVGVFVSYVGVASDLDPEEVSTAVWETLEGDPVALAAVRPWGNSPVPDLGYRPALFALAPPPGDGGVAKADPAFQAALQTVIDAGGARLTVTNVDGFEFTVDVPVELDTATDADRPVGRPAVRLAAAPNPFNPRTVLSFELPRSSHVALDVFGVDGRWITSLVDGPREAGTHRVVWDGRDERGREVASGSYLARLRVDGSEDTRKVTLVR